MNEVQSDTIARFLLSASAHEAASALSGPQDSRRLLLQLRKTFSPWQAAALVGQERARQAMAGRHGLAARLYLDGLAASQASSEACADRRASKFPTGALVADLGCSVGIDSLALAARGPLVALDRDLGRLILARANLKLRGLAALFIQGSAPEAAPTADFLSADPDRRSGASRSYDPEDGSPPLSALLALKPRGGLAVKLSPMAALEPLESFGELEFVGAGSELKEIVLYTGALAHGRRRAVLADQNFEFVADEVPAPVATQLSDFVIESHSALVRSGLMGALARAEGLGLISPQIAYLTGPAPAKSPFLRSFQVLEVVAPEPKKIRKAMTAHRIERVEVSSRGFPGDLSSFERALSKGKGLAGRVFLTRLQGQHVAILSRRVQD